MRVLGYRGVWVLGHSGSRGIRMLGTRVLRYQGIWVFGHGH